MTNARFTPTARLLHWLMAAMILAMLFIGIGMVASDRAYGSLVAVHRPLGVAVLVLAALRLAYRQMNPPPPLPKAMPTRLQVLASLSHRALYVLMFAVPLVGWGMLSAGAYPVTLYGALHLPPILPHDRTLYAVLRMAHTILAASLFAAFLLHLGAALLHAFLFRDGVFESMASLRGDGDGER